MHIILCFLLQEFTWDICWSPSSIFLNYTHIHLHILKSLYHSGYEFSSWFTFSLFHCLKVKFTTSLVFYFKSSLLEHLMYSFHIYTFYFIFNLFWFCFIIFPHPPPPGPPFASSSKWMYKWYLGLNSHFENMNVLPFMNKNETK